MHIKINKFVPCVIHGADATDSYVLTGFLAGLTTINHQLVSSAFTFVYLLCARYITSVLSLQATYA